MFEIYLKVMSPEGPDLVLTAHIPDSEADVLVLDSLHIEPDGGDGRHDLPQLQLVQDRCLTSSIQTWKQESFTSILKFLLKNLEQLIKWLILNEKYITYQPLGSSYPSYQTVAWTKMKM